MTINELTEISRTARKAGLENLLQLSIVAALLNRGEATLLSLANSLGVKLEAVAHACAMMETAGASKHIVCREAVGFTLARLTPKSEDAFRQLLEAHKPQEPLRVKKLGLRITR
jgi:DNA-binding MarR family transcriptional regulator